MGLHNVSLWTIFWPTKGLTRRSQDILLQMRWPFTCSGFSHGYGIPFSPLSEGVIGLKETLLPSLGPPPLVLEGVKQGHYEHHSLVNTALDMAKKEGTLWNTPSYATMSSTPQTTPNIGRHVSKEVH